MGKAEQTCNGCARYGLVRNSKIIDQSRFSQMDGGKNARRLIRRLDKGEIFRVANLQIVKLSKTGTAKFRPAPGKNFCNHATLL